MKDFEIIAVVGATATGKSDVALELCELLGGQAINADASQLYRGMDIGTAKLSVEERRSVPHHLLDVLDVRETASVAVYQEKSREAADRIRAAGDVPVAVGGSGLYVRALLDDLRFPGTDPDVRATVAAAVHERGVQWGYEELARLDPVAAESIDSRNERRIVRALEVIELTGEPFSATMPKRQYVRPSLQIGLTVSNDVLDARIEARAAAMVERGLIEECLELVDQGLLEGTTASRALGYAQVIEQLPGKVDPDLVIEETAAATRKFARRQVKWFRPDERIMWLDGTKTAKELAAEAMARIDCGEVSR